MGGRDNVEKNQAKRTHARCGDERKVRESGEREGRERGPRKNSKRESGGGGDNGKESSKEDTFKGWRWTKSKRGWKQTHEGGKER